MSKSETPPDWQHGRSRALVSRGESHQSNKNPSLAAHKNQFRFLKKQNKKTRTEDITLCDLIKIRGIAQNLPSQGKPSWKKR